MLFKKDMFSVEVETLKNDEDEWYLEYNTRFRDSRLDTHWSFRDVVEYMNWENEFVILGWNEFRLKNENIHPKMYFEIRPCQDGSGVWVALMFNDRTVDSFDTLEKAIDYAQGKDFDE